MLQTSSSVFVVYRRKTLTGSPDPTHATSMDKPCTRDFCQLPVDMQQLINQYFHREELEARVTTEEEESMSTDTEAAETVRRLNLQCPKSTESLQVAVRKALVLAMAPRPTEEEYYYDSNDSVVDLDEQYPNLAERIVQWQAAQKGAVSAPPWHLPNFGQQE